jgi:hypothetical protein
MKKHVLFLLILSYALTNSYAQEKKIPVEPSEAWLNSQHQPEKLMEVIGLKEGMVIVERDPVKTGQSRSESTSKDKLIGQLTEAGYECTKVDTALLERDNIYFFRVKKDPNSPSERL